MHHPILRVAFLIPCLLALASAPARGQQPDAAAASPAVATTRTDGSVTATGPDYHLHATRGGVAFLAILGETTAGDATAPASLQFTLESVRRGDQVLFADAASAAPIASAATTIRYQHSPTLTEVYDLRADGVEQSFVFARRPEGHGDLVVRGAITTQLPLASYSDDGVRYEQDGAGIAFGAVTGIDANGATVRGSIRAGADFVEWVLPASFVEHCAYPLVLDPLIGNAFSIASTSGTDDVLPNVAYDTSSNRYLVVWNVVQSTTVAEVRGQFLGSDGALIGSSFVIESDGLVTTRPQVVNINASNRFLVVFRRSANTPSGFDAGWHARAVTAADGSMSGRVVVEPTPALALDPVPEDCALAGDLRSVAGGSDQAALMALRRNAASSPIPGVSFGERIYTRKIQVPTSGDPIVGSQVALLEVSDQLEDVAISTNGGTNGRWLISYARAVAPATTPTRIWAHFVNEDGLVCGAPVLVRSANTGARKPTVATKDGVHFALAWQEDATLGLVVRTVTTNGTCSSLTSLLGSSVQPTTGGINTQPRLEFARDKYVLVWRRSFLTGSASRVFVRGLDPDGCGACGDEWSVDNTLLGLDAPAVATRWGGGNTLNDEALVVWSNTAVRGRRFEASGAPQVLDLGGGCVGPIGSAPSYIGQPRLGDANFALTLPLPTAPVLAAIVGFTEVPLPCGPCTLIPNADIVIAGPGPHGIPIPCNPAWIGGQFTAQWLMFTPGGCPVLPDLALSRALRFTIVE